MAKPSIQSFVEFASGLGEMTLSRANEAAAELLAIPTMAPKTGKQVAKQASDLAEGLLHAAESNRQQLLSMVRTEVEGALRRLDLVAALRELESLRTTVTHLLGRVEELSGALGVGAGGPATTRPKAQQGPPSATTDKDGTRPARLAHSAPKPLAPSIPAEPDDAVPAPRASVASGPAKKVAPVRKAAPAKKASAGSAPVRKAAPAKKASAGSAPARKAAPAKKTSAGSAPARKAAPAKKASAGSAPAKKTRPTTAAPEASGAPETSDSSSS